MVLDGSKMTTRRALHDVLKEAFQLPAHYGSNLDALNDCLSELDFTEKVIIIHAGFMKDSLGAYAERLMDVFSANGIKVSLTDDSYETGGQQ